MQNFDLAPIILLIFFVLLPLVNYLLHRMGRRFEHPTPSRQPMPDMGFRRQAAPSSASAANREPAHVTPPTEAMTPRRSRGSRPVLFRTRGDVRRAIIAMTLLGSCRAYDPPD
ncbi:MAG TPA: hypothetical protein VGK77_26700 [Candidatus Binatia bacterium]|jgi:hypothetical protein